jgi:hypothetical protein
VDDLLATVAGLQVALTGLVELVTRLLAAGAPVDRIDWSSGEDAAPIDARRRRANARSDRATARPGRACSQSVQEQGPGDPHSLTGLTARSDARQARDVDRAPVRGDNELDELLAPLVALCDGLQLVGVTNRTRLHAALHGYTYGQVEQAIGMLARQLRAGAPIRSPVGLLVRLAEQRDRSYFPPPASPPPATPRPAHMEPPPVEATGSVERGAPDLVLTAELAATVDAEITASFAPLPVTVRERLLADNDAIQRLRNALLAERIGGQATPRLDCAPTQ